MQIQSIELHNFRNLISETINFSTDKDKNFTIILGQNTFGKTTLVKAFIWCLYRQNLFKDKVLLNEIVQNGMHSGDKENVKVVLRLVHGGSLYQITTQETYCMGTNLFVYSKARTSIIKFSPERNDAVPIRDEDIDQEIESILRPELKEYFFFDGETNTISGVASKKNLTSAVTNILKLNRVERLRDYFDKRSSNGVYRALENELDLKLDDLDLEVLGERLRKADDGLKATEKQIEDCESEIQKLEQQIAEKEDELEQNSDIKESQTLKKKLEASIRANSDEKEKSFTNTIAAFNASNCFARILFSKAFTKFNLKAVLSHSSFNGEASYRGINEEAVNDLIKAGRCICGAVIESGNDAYNHLMIAKEHMEPHDFSKYISDFVSAEDSNCFSARSAADGIQKSAGRVNDLIDQIDSDKQQLSGVKKRIEGRVDVGEIQTEQNNMLVQLGRKNEELRHCLNEKLPGIKLEQERISAKKQNASKKIESNKYIQKCLFYVDNIYTLADNKINRERKNIRDALQKSVNSIFSKMYHGKREIVIDENFRADTIYRGDGKDSNLDKSTGLSTVVNYAFVAGLMHVAKTYRCDDDDIEDDDLSAEIYPLVMDAPFSNLDSEHIKNICSALALNCDQIIMFVMEKDFDCASATISKRIGKMYRLNKLSETEAHLEEEKI